MKQLGKKKERKKKEKEKERKKKIRKIEWLPKREMLRLVVSGAAERERKPASLY